MKNIGKKGFILGCALAALSHFNGCNYLRRDEIMSYRINNRDSGYMKSSKSLEKTLEKSRKKCFEEMKKEISEYNLYYHKKSLEIEKSGFISWTLLDRSDVQRPIFAEAIGDSYESSARNSFLTAEILLVLFNKRKERNMSRRAFYDSIDLKNDGIITKIEFDKKLGDMGYKGYNFVGSLNSKTNSIELLKEGGGKDMIVSYRP